MVKTVLALLFGESASGFGSAGIRRQQVCGGIYVVGGGGWENAQRGVEFDEVGMNISRHECRYYLAVNEKMPSNVGEPRARAFSDRWSREIKQEGELVGAIPHAIATACELANDTDDLGDGAGDIFLDEGTVVSERGGWRTASLSFSSDPNITVG